MLNQISIHLLLILLHKTICRQFETCSCNAHQLTGAKRRVHSWLDSWANRECTTVFDEVMPLYSNNRVVLISTKINKAFQLVSIIRDLVNSSWSIALHLTLKLFMRMPNIYTYEWLVFSFSIQQNAVKCVFFVALLFLFFFVFKFLHFQLNATQ